MSAAHVTSMLDRIVTVLETGGHELPSLRNLAYGGSKTFSVDYTAPVANAGIDPTVIDDVVADPHQALVLRINVTASPTVFTWSAASSVTAIPNASSRRWTNTTSIFRKGVTLPKSAIFGR